MKVSIESDDLGEIDTFTHALGYSLALWDIQQKLRERVKYGNLGEEAYNELDAIYKMVYALRQEYHLPED